jgi:C2H2-type zinc finger
MRRVFLGTAGLVITTLIALLLMAWAAPIGHASPTAATPLAAPTAPAAHPGAPLAIVGNATATAQFTNAFSIGVSPFWVLPINVTWTETETNATITAANLTITLNVTWNGELVFAGAYDGSDASSCTSANSCSFYQPIATADLLAGFGLTGADQLPTGQYIFLLTSTATNSSALLPVYTSTSTQASTNLAPYPAYGQFLSPLGSWQAGALTVAGNFSGTYLVGATVTVYNASKGEVFSAGVFSPEPNREYAFAVPWTVATAGTYNLVLTLTEQWGATQNFSANVTITAVPPATHTYSNSTWGVAGLGPGASAAVLVTLGVIIGIIVMALVGRGLWGGTKPAPAQPWTGEKPAMTPGPGGTFECSVCHQTFPTEDALKEHAKSQHGITM